MMEYSFVTVMMGYSASSDKDKEAEQDGDKRESTTTTTVGPSDRGVRCE
jgi:hypothetical protein